MGSLDRLCFERVTFKNSSNIVLCLAFTLSPKYSVVLGNAKGIGGDGICWKPLKLRFKTRLTVFKTFAKVDHKTLYLGENCAGACWMPSYWFSSTFEILFPQKFLWKNNISVKVFCCSFYQSALHICSRKLSKRRCASCYIVYMETMYKKALKLFYKKIPKLSLYPKVMSW